HCLKRQAFELGIGEQVTFLGGYRQSELPGLLENADVYVSAKPTDDASVSLLEAMASGVFPVVTDIAGNREWLSGTGDGLLFPRREAPALAAALRIAIENSQLRHAAVDLNRQKIWRHGDRHKNLVTLASVYEELIERYRRRRYQE